MEEEITLWLERLEHQPAEAMERIWANYFQKLVRFARSRLRGLPPRSADEEDVALSAMNSFYNGIRQHRFRDIRSRNELWKLLLTLAARKASRQVRRNSTQKRGGGAVRGESVFGQSDGLEGIDNVAATPSDEFAEVVVNELIERMDQLDDPLLKTVVTMKLEGHTNREIADALQVVPRTVDRKLARIRGLWATDID